MTTAHPDDTHTHHKRLPPSGDMRSSWKDVLATGAAVGVRDDRDTRAVDAKDASSSCHPGKAEVEDVGDVAGTDVVLDTRRAMERDSF